MPHDEIEYAVQAIKDFLAVRPEMADTMEGIHQWWIRWPDSSSPLNITEAALQRLEAEGVIESAQIGQRTLWRLRR